VKDGATFAMWIIAAVTAGLTLLSVLYLKNRTAGMAGVTDETFWPIGWVTAAVFIAIGAVMGIFIIMVLRKNANLKKGE